MRHFIFLPYTRPEELIPRDYVWSFSFIFRFFKIGIFFMFSCSHDYISTLFALYVTGRGYFQDSILSLFQALLIRRCRMKYYVIQVSFCREFQTSFFRAHHQSPHTFLSISF